MKLIVNGQTLETQAQTLALLLNELGYQDKWYATALNSDFVPGHERETTPLSEGDRIEVLAPRQGG